MNARRALALLVVSLAACSDGSSGGGSPGPGPGPGPGGAGAVSATRSSVAVDRAEGVIADGLDAVAVVVTLRDGDGAPVANAVVKLSVSGDGAALEGGYPANAASGTSAVDGTFRTKLRSTRIGPKTLSATATVYPSGAVSPLADTPVVTFVAGPPTPETLTLTVTKQDPLFADGVGAATVTVRVTDRGGNPLPGRAVALDVTGDASFAQPGPTDGGGTTSASLTTLRHGEKVISATVDPATVPVVSAARAKVTFLPDPPDVISAATDPIVTGCAKVGYHVQQYESLPANVEIAYDPGDGVFRRATQAGSDAIGDEGLLARSTAYPTTPSHGFLWDSTRDLPRAAGPARVRVRAEIGGHFGAELVRDVTVANGLAFSATAGTAAAGRILASGDFDRDGKLDLVAQVGGSVLFLRGTGSTGAAAFGTGTIVASVTTSGAAAGDFNGDGKLDVAFVSGTWLGVALGNGAGGFTLSSQTLTKGGSFLASADVDRDGKLDLVAVAPLPGVSVLKGDGAGHFTAAVDGPFASGHALAVGDLDRDGRLDVAVMYEGSPTVTVALQTASGWSSADYATGAGLQAIAIGDLDRDGRPDIATAGADGKVRVLHATGQGSFEVGPAQDATTNPLSLAVADLDRDGVSDLVVSGGGGTVALRGGAGPAIAVGAASLSSVVDDLDRDGLPDVVSSGANLSVARNLAAHRCAPSFATPTWSPGAQDLVHLAIGDVDRDGKLDVVHVSSTDALSVELGRGDGTFTAGSSYGGFSGARFVALGDLTGDGVLDVAVAREASNRLEVMPGMPDGTFGAGVSLAVDGGPSSVVIADLSGDGVGDLAVTCRASGDVVVLRGRGDLTFDAGVAVTTYGAYDGISAADLNGDGRTDLLLRKSFNDYLPQVLVNGGAGAFTAQDLWTGDGAYDAAAVAAGDVDGDGVPEVVSTGWTTSGNGTVVWGPTGWDSYQREQTVSGTGDAVAVGSLDGDPYADVLAGGAGGVRGFLGGTTGLGAGVNTSLPNLSKASLAIADLDQDGLGDLLALGASTSAAPPGIGLLAARGRGDGGFEAPAPLKVPIDGYFGATIVPADLDRDGRVELVAATGYEDQFDPGALWVLRRGPGGAWVRDAGVAITDDVVALALGDLDRDGVLDVIAATTQYRLATLRGNGDGTFATPTYLTLAARLRALALADLDRDGDLDAVALTRDTNELTVFLGDGAGGLAAQPAVKLPTAGGLPRVPTALAIADLNRDGKPDLLVAWGAQLATPSSGLAFLAGKGDGTFTIPATFGAAAAAYAEVRLADLDGDGRLDLVGGAAGSAAVHAGNGDGTFGAPVAIPVAAKAIGLELADWDGDGRLDLFSLPGDPGGLEPADRVEIFRGAAGGGFAAAPDAFYAGLEPVRLVASDLDGDGIVDLALGLDPFDGDASVAVLRGR